MNIFTLQRLLLFSLLSFILTPRIVAQGTPLSKADLLMDKGDYRDAARMYQKYIVTHPGDQHTTERLGDCYRHLGNSRSAEIYYANAVNGELSDNIYTFWYGTTLMNTGHYERAATQFKAYLELNPDDLLAQTKLQSCLHSHRFMENEGKYIITPLATNTPFSEFVSDFHEEKVLFSSMIGEKSWIFGPVVPNKYDISIATWTKGNELVKPVHLWGDANTPEYHEAAACFGPDGKSIFFTRNSQENGMTGVNGNKVSTLQTFQGKYEGNKVRGNHYMPFNNESYSSGHPTLSPDGSFMIVASDRPGGAGGTDLYRIDIQGSEWGTPVNLGFAVNTPGNEMFPWIGEDGTLYFASDGLPGLGGLDIYSVDWKNEEWETPHNMGAPMNTSFDDFAFVYNKVQNAGFFSSNREGGKGGDDIYSFSMRQRCNFVVINEKTGMPLPNANVQISVAGEILEYDVTDALGGIWFYPPDQVEFEVIVTSNGYLGNDWTVTLADFDPAFGNRKTVSIEGLYLDEEPATNVMVEGEVNKGNTNTSLIGAHVVVYAKEKEIILNQDEKFLSNLPSGKEYLIKVDGKEIPMNQTQFDTYAAASGETLGVHINFNPSGDYMNKIFYTIFYPPNQHDLHAASSHELDQVVSFMKNFPEAKVEIRSHTDSRGTQDQNWELSRKRAEDSFNYLVSKGIAENRLSYIWFGETQPVNRCTDGITCTEAELEQNRRTEFKLLLHPNDKHANSSNTNTGSISESGHASGMTE